MEITSKVCHAVVPVLDAANGQLAKLPNEDVLEDLFGSTPNRRMLDRVVDVTSLELASSLYWKANRNEPDNAHALRLGD